jgi:hypothetical protein
MAIKIKVGPKANEKLISLELNIRETLDGNYMIFDHIDIDIVIVSDQGKILTLPKELITDQVYGAQNRLFSYLKKKGVIDMSSIQGGNIYGSMEAKLLDTEGAIEYALLNISKFIDEERPYFNYLDAHLEDHEEHVTNPDKENSTELGDVEHSSQKGSLRPDYMRDMYGLHGYISGY